MRGELVDLVTGYNGLLLAGLVIGILLFVIAPVSADVHIINPGDSIQNTIDTVADDGDTILLNQGTYNEYDIPVSKNITIGANPADGANAGNTHIDAGLSGRIFNVTGNVSLTVDNLTLQNGRAPNGANGGTDIYGLPETGGHGGDGGAISAFGSVTIVSSVLTGCSAGNGGRGGPGDFGGNPGAIGGTGGSGGAVNSTFGVTLADSTISSCNGGNGGTGGISGGMMSQGGAGGDGGSGSAVSSDYPVTITSSYISDCSAGTGGAGGNGYGETSGNGGGGGHGGALNTKTSHGPVTVTLSTITDCSAGDGGISYDNRGGDGGNGGAIASLGRVTITSSTISTCSAGAGGDSAIYDDGYGGGGGAIYGYLEGDMTVIDSTITGNHAGNGRVNTISGPGRFDSGGPGGYGGAIYLYNTGTADVTSSTITNNVAGNSGNGGAIASQVSNVNSSTMTGNSVSGGGTGSAIHSWYGNVHFNRIYNNADPALTEVDYTHIADNSIEAQNNWWGTNGNPSSRTLGNVTYSPWLVLGATATPYSIPISHTSAIRANLTYNSAGTNTSSGVYVPDAIPVAFTFAPGSSGTLSPGFGGTESGNNATTFAPDVTGISTIRTTVDGQYVDTDVFVPITARFTGTPTTGPAPLFVQFNDTSDCTTPLMWNWSLGDGTWFNTTDILQRNASTTYTAPDIYTVSLTIADATGSNTSTRVDYISVLIPPPTVSAITPTTGINTTTVSITHLAGTDFNTTHSPVLVKLNRTGFTDIGGTDVTVVDSTNITCRFDLTGRQAGTWNVVVTNPDNQEGMLAGGFEIQTTTPSVTGINPASGFNSSTVDITYLAGDGFWTGSSTTGVVLRRSGYTDIDGTDVTVLSPAQIACTFDLTGHAAGMWDVVVTNPDGKTETLPGAFEIFPPVPTITGITPAYGVNITTIDITNLAGSGFWPGSLTDVILNGTGYTENPATDVTVVDGTTITCRFNIAGQEEGLRNVVVTNPDGQVAMLTNGFRIRAPGPVISTITPAYGVNITTIEITDLAGSGFWTTGITNVFLNRTGHPDIPATAIMVVDSTTITCRFNIAGQGEGPWNVVVANPDGQEAMLTDGFRVWTPAPVITAITPASGINSTTVSITNLAGTGFWTSGTMHIFLNRTGSLDTIVAGDIVVIDSTHITCTFDLTGQEAGLRNIVVTNPDGQVAMLTDGFTILIPGPGITGITPSSGYNTGIINITRLAGTDFWTTDTTVVFLNRTGSPDIVATNVTVIDRTAITCLLNLTGQDIGLWNVVVINPDGQEIMLANGFRIRQVEAPTPTPEATLDTSGNDDGFPTSIPTETIIPQTTTSLSNITENVTVNIGGSSAFSRAVVSGTGITGLIVTGTVTSTPDETPLTPGSVYQYADIVPARYNTIRSAEIFFSLPQEWLDDQKIAPGSIVLYRRTAGSWNALPTRVLNTKDGTVNYAAVSPGFSLFAIAGTPADATLVTVTTTKEIMNRVVQEQPPAPAVAMDVPVTTQTTAPPGPAEAPAGFSAFPLIPALIGVGCAAIIGGGWYVRRWWIRRQNPALFAEYD